MINSVKLGWENSMIHKPNFVKLPFKCFTLYWKADRRLQLYKQKKLQLNLKRKSNINIRVSNFLSDRFIQIMQMFYPV